MSENDKPRRFQQPAKDNPHFAAIGRITSGWATLDYEIDQMVWALADVDYIYGACVTAQFGHTHARLRALQALMAVRKADPEITKAVKKFVTDTQALINKRNRMVHDHWLYEAASKTMHRMQVTADPTPVFDLKDTPLAHVIQIAEEVEAHVVRFLFTRAEITKRLLPSLYKETMQGYGLSLRPVVQPSKATTRE